MHLLCMWTDGDGDGDGEGEGEGDGIMGIQGEDDGEYLSEC